MIKYKILKAKDKTEFEEKVNEILKDGWALHGGTTVLMPYQQVYEFYFQAFTKSEKKDIQ